MWGEIRCTTVAWDRTLPSQPPRVVTFIHQECVNDHLLCFEKRVAECMSLHACSESVPCLTDHERTISQTVYECLSKDSHRYAASDESPSMVECERAWIVDDSEPEFETPVDGFRLRLDADAKSSQGGHSWRLDFCFGTSSGSRIKDLILRCRSMRRGMFVFTALEDTPASHVEVPISLSICPSSFPHGRWCSLLVFGSFLLVAMRMQYINAAVCPQPTAETSTRVT